ncbi:MAG: histidine triad nucleotide-binding protein [Bacillota bacterium]
MDCLFCKIRAGEIPATKVYEDEKMMIIRDIDPKAKNHFLAIPKNHFKLLSEMTAEDKSLLGEIFATIASLEELLELQNGYRLVINQGDDAGQTVFHLHIHILSGEKMGWTPA